MSIRRAHLPTGAAAGIGAWLLWYGKYSIDRVRTASARLADPAGHVARLDAIIRSGTEATLTDHAAAADFKPRLVQHLRWSLGGLEEHHQVEDFHYFPVFRRAEPRLAPGFELLERDHGALHTAMAGIVECAKRRPHGGNHRQRPLPRRARALPRRPSRARPRPPASPRRRGGPW